MYIRSIPTLTEAALFRTKVTLLQLRRLLNQTVQGDAHQFQVSLTEILPVAFQCLAWSRTPLYTATTTSEQILELGKVHNLRLAIRTIHGIEIPAHQIFSFWRQVGFPSRWRGYVVGRELREGCLIPSIGGGLCQLSNALYDAALQAGLDIVERHAHTQVIPGSLAEVGRDATVFWNYVDLRFKAPYPLTVQATMDDRWLNVRIWAAAEHVAPLPNPSTPVIAPTISPKLAPSSSPHNCLSCSEINCFRHSPVQNGATQLGRTAVLVDEYWPEFDHYLEHNHRPQDLLLLPLNGQNWRKANYAWNTANYAQVRQSPLVAMERAWQSRQLAQQGAQRQMALLNFAKKLAHHYAQQLTYDITHLVVMQHLLPWLWQAGHLAGRTFDVLMTALPLGTLQTQLDQAATLYPESKTLKDFRTQDGLVRLEAEALAQARYIITPHSEIATFYADKTQLLDWIFPPIGHLSEPASPPNGKSEQPIIVFPASTLGRKGAYELRAAIAHQNLALRVVGTELEGDNFWDNIPVEHSTNSQDWWTGASLVVLPAWIEHNPRRLLNALARGVPVIASAACGLAHTPGVVTVEVGNVSALQRAILDTIGSTVNSA